MYPALMIFLAASIILIKGVSVPMATLMVPVLASAGLMLVSRAYKFRAPNFTLCLSALASLVAFSTAFVLAMDALAINGGALHDDVLRRWDAFFGLSAASATAWFRERPALNRVMELAYFSAIPQTIIAIVWFGLRNDESLLLFLKRYMACAVVTLLIFGLFPARGSYVDVPASMQAVAERFDNLHAGVITALDATKAQGIITFPSFHTVWAVLLVALFSRTLPFIFTFLNILMVVSTIPVGCHYFVDIAGGATVALISILVFRAES